MDLVSLRKQGFTVVFDPVTDRIGIKPSSKLTPEQLQQLPKAKANIIEQIKAENGNALPAIKVKPPKQYVRGGVGTELREIIPKFFERKGCNCKSYAKDLDRHGLQWCIDHREEIIEHLVSKATETFIGSLSETLDRFVATRWVDKAIQNAKQNTCSLFIVDDVVYPAINSFVAVTSLSPHRHERQQECLDTWKRMGLTIVAVQSSHEIESVRSNYPQVDEWVIASGTGVPLINNLIDVAITRNQPILLINSDIEIRGTQTQLLDSIAPGCVTVGIRYNYDETYWTGQREKWGLDAFWIEPAIAASLPRLPLRIGKPGWDHWLPIHFSEHGITTRWIGYGLFFHRRHPLQWSQQDHRDCFVHIQRHYPACKDATHHRGILPFGIRAKTPESNSVVIENRLRYAADHRIGRFAAE